ncbi:MAG: hypothetical protein K2Y37_18735 [Pirellulales bacterium]|nr:hypothetical protein [Pirellulales bacterium]
MTGMERWSLRLVLAGACTALAFLDTLAFDLEPPASWYAVVAFPPLVGAGLGALFGRPLRGAIIALAIGSLLLPYLIFLIYGAG